MTEDEDQDHPEPDSSLENSDVPEEQAIEQQIVPFMGDELAAAMTAGGNIYITLPGMCAALGLNTKGQMQRVKRTRALVVGLRLIPLKTGGGVQRINCLRVDRIALWLAGVQTDRLAPRFRPKIERYQDELAPVAMQVFMRVAGITTAQLVPTAAGQQVAALAEQIDS